MGELNEMKQIGGKSRLLFMCPSRTLLGLRAELLTGFQFLFFVKFQETRGSAVFNHLFHSYVPYKVLYYL
jgi:GTP-binding protein